MTLTRLIPMLNVSNIDKSVGFYREALGFEVVSDPALVSEWRWATIRSGDVELMLSETGSAPGLRTTVDPHANTSWPVIFYFYPDDVSALFAEVIRKGYQSTPLEVTHYGMLEFSLQDPDGHVLSFGQDADEANGARESA